MIMEYMNEEAVIRVADGESEPGVIGRGVSQDAHCRLCYSLSMQKV